MKDIKFEKVRIQNFLSFGGTPVEFYFKPGVHFVTGVNKDESDDEAESRNGVGKTTLIVESIAFALFGETYRKINNADISNWATHKQCIVELWFYVNNDYYHVSRALNPSTLILEKNGDGGSKSKTIPQTEKDILDILSISKEIFTNIMISTSKQTRFLSQGKAIKTKFIDGLTDLEFISEMLEKAKKTFNKTNEEVIKSESALKQVRISLSSDRDYSESFDAKIKKQIGDISDQMYDVKQTQIPDNSQDIVKYEDKIKEKKAEIEALTDKENKINVKKATLKSDIKNKQVQIRSFDDIKFECPTCKRPYDGATHDKSHIEANKKALKDEIAGIQTNITTLDGGLSKITSKKEALNEEIEIAKAIIEDFKKRQQKYEQTSRILAGMQAEIDRLKAEKNPFLDKITKQEANEKELSDKLDVLRTDLKVDEIVKSIPTEAKRVAIKKIINTFNKRFNKYIQRLKAPCKITFDEFFEEKILNKKGKEISYGNLSGGEAGRVDFSLLFGFRDLRAIQSNVKINISAFDELFDSAIDKKAMNEILTMLKEMAEENNECYYIITHSNMNDLDTDGCNFINLEKENGITRIVSGN